MVEELKQVIRYGVVELEIPSGFSPKKALDFYSVNNPELSVATLNEGRLDGDKMVYEVVKEKNVGTKG